MKKWAIYLATFLGVAAMPVFSAHANGPWFRAFQDYKYPSQAALEHYSWATPATSSTTVLVNGQSVSGFAVNTLGTFVAQPDVPRTISVTFGGSLGSVGGGNVVVAGLNIFGKPILEQLAIGNGQAGSVTTQRAFQSVSSVTLPASLGVSSLVSVGLGSSLGLIRCSDRVGDYVFSEFDSAYETSRGTMKVNSTLVELNTFQPNGTLNGAKRADLFSVQNYRCFGN